MSISASPIESRYHVKKYQDESDFCNMELAKENAYSILLINCSSIFPATTVFSKVVNCIGVNTSAIICKYFMYSVSISNDFNKYVDGS